MTDAFYLPLGGERYLPTVHTTGPWSPDAQHFGPPSALLVRALEGVEGGQGKQLVRVTVEILGPAPLTELTIRAGLDRPGRSVELLSAELRDGARTVARASAWRISTSDTTEIVANLAEPLRPLPDDAPEARWPEGWHGGYFEAVELLAVRGGPDQPGACAVWGRARVALIDDEKSSPLQRLFTFADSGNGVSNFLDPRRWWFINTELTVHLLREPEGDWVGLDARTTVGAHGLGTATSTLHDLSGQVGTGAQALMVRTRAG